MHLGMDYNAVQAVSEYQFFGLVYSWLMGVPRLSNQENGVLQGNKVSYSIESWKWGIFRQRQLFCNRKISSVLGCPAFSTGFPHSTVCSPSGRGGHFCPSTSLPAYFRAKMPTPALRAAYCFMRKTSSSCRATNYIQFFSLLQSFFSVYIHHISVILLNKRTFFWKWNWL